jgi:hypothetical protein
VAWVSPHRAKLRVHFLRALPVPRPLRRHGADLVPRDRDDPGTVVGISEDGRSIFFQQDKPHRARGTYFGAAFVFTPALPIQQVFQANLGDDGRYNFARNGVAVELGVRRCFTTRVLAPTSTRDQSPVRPSTGSGRMGVGERSPPRDD